MDNRLIRSDFQSISWVSPDPKYQVLLLTAFTEEALPSTQEAAFGLLVELQITALDGLTA